MTVDSSVINEWADIDPYSQIPPLQLLEQEIRTQRVERIGVERIVIDAGIVDDAHVAALARSINGPRGQLSNILVRARLNDDRIDFDIIDRYHRVGALQTLKRPYAAAKVVYGCNDEELFDLRVLAANSVRSISYARIATWMHNSFRQTEWYHRGLSLAQLSSLALQESNGSRLGLTPEDVERACAWLQEKTDIWNRPVSAIWNISRAHEAAAPGLIYAVRVGGGGPHGKHGELSPARFNAIVLPLAGEFDLQLRLVKVVLDQNIVAKDAEVLAKAIDAAKEDLDKVNNILAEPQSVIQATKQVKSIHHRYQPAKSKNDGQPYSPPTPTETSLRQDLDQVRTELKTTLYENAKLRQQVESLQTAQLDPIFWWRNAAFLSPIEQTIVKRFLEDGESPEYISHDLDLLPNNVLLLLQSAFRKYILTIKR